MIKLSLSIYSLFSALISAFLTYISISSKSYFSFIESVSLILSGEVALVTFPSPLLKLLLSAGDMAS